MRRAISKSFTDYGGNGPVVVLLHGFLASSKYWSKLQPQLSAMGLRVITIDLLGFGAAPKPASSRYGYAEHTAHIARAIREVGITAPFTLIGHSMGALLASHYASLYPEQISSAVLLHPPLYKDLEEARAALRDTGKIYRFLLDSKYRRIGWMIVRTLLAYWIGRHSRHSREWSMRNVIEVTDIFGELETASVNVLLFVGTHDRRQYTRNLGRASLSKHVVVVSKDVSHHSPLKNPLLIRNVIADFLRR